MDGNKPHQELGKDRAKARFLFVFFSLQQGDPPTDKGGWHGPTVQDTVTALLWPRIW